MRMLFTVGALIGILFFSPSVVADRPAQSACLGFAKPGTHEERAFRRAQTFAISLQREGLAALLKDTDRSLWTLLIAAMNAQTAGEALGPLKIYTAGSSLTFLL